MYREPLGHHSRWSRRSGALAAYTSAKKGFKTLLLEKQRLPRYKVCGGAISVRAQNLLPFKLPNEIIEEAIEGFVLHFGDFAAKAVCKAGKIADLTFRDRFDNFLVKKACERGAVLKDATRVKSVFEKKDVVELTTGDETLKASHVIAADGATSDIASQIGLRRV